jgi:hypothetical protein
LYTNLAENKWVNSTVDVRQDITENQNLSKMLILPSISKVVPQPHDVVREHADGKDYKSQDKNLRYFQFLERALLRVNGMTSAARIAHLIKAN